MTTTSSAINIVISLYLCHVVIPLSMLPGAAPGTLAFDTQCIASLIANKVKIDNRPYAQESPSLCMETEELELE